jgi:hypothetical protein
VRALALAVALAACGRDAPLDDVVPGARIGGIELGMPWRDVIAQLGAPAAEPVVLVRLGVASWASGIEVLLTSPDDAALTDDAIVIGVAAERSVDRAAIESLHGAAPEQYNGHAYYATGFAVQYGDDDEAERIAVFAREGAARDGIDAVRFPAGTDIGDRVAAVVDMHLHPGDYATMAPTGKAFVAANLPPALQIFAPDLLDRLSDPWAKHVGIAEQTALAGIAHAVLFAVYAPHSTGVFDNAALLALLDDPRNLTGDGRPWAWGMASIDFEGWNDEVGPARLAELRELLATRRDKLIGIKLAHAHQQVRLDDAAYEGVYAIAAEVGVTVLLHTGLSPFPGTQTEPSYYDPSHLDSVVARFPDVDFVLSHVGQGDQRAVKHAIDLAAARDNVWLELSALGRPPLVDEHGDTAATTEPQYPAVLAAIRDRGVITRTLFASDGPQYSGAVRGYLTKLVAGMRAAGYSPAELEAVLAGNFVRLFRRVPPPAR